MPAMVAKKKSAERPRVYSAKDDLDDQEDDDEDDDGLNDHQNNEEWKRDEENVGEDEAEVISSGGVRSSNASQSAAANA